MSTAAAPTSTSSCGGRWSTARPARSTTRSGWSAPAPRPTRRSGTTRSPRGSYHVLYQWAVWDGTRGQWVYSGWVQVTGAGLNTYGTNNSPGSILYIGGSTGHCTI